MVKYQNNYPNLYNEVLENFLRFDYETQNQIIDAFLLYSDCDQISKEILRIRKYIETKEFCRNFDNYLSSLTDEEFKMLQTMVCRTILDYHKYPNYLCLDFSSDTYMYDNYLYDFYQECYAVYPLTRYALEKETRGTYEEGTIPFDITSFIEQFETHYCTHESKILIPFEWAFTEKYYDELLVNKKFSIDSTIDEFPLIIEDNIQLYRKLLSPKALEIFDSLSKNEQILLIVSLPFISKEKLAREIEWNKESKEEHKTTLTSTRRQRVILNERNPKNQRYISGNKYTKNKRPRIRERKKQINIVR